MKKLVAVTIMCTALTAQAEFLSGNKLLQYMQGTELERGFALGYVAGAFDVGMNTNHCPPQQVTIQQVLDITKLVLEKLPQHRDKSADSFVSFALKQAWPCKQQPQRQI